MVIPSGVNIPMPRPYGGNPPVITRSPKGEGEEGDHIIVQLVGEIGPTTQYLELYDVMDAATEKDDVEIRIDTPGGDVYTATAIVERMENCKANVITTASGLVASAGTFIWFYGKERRVNRWARFLFHCSSHGDVGRSLSILETSEKLVKYMKELGLEMLGAGLITRAEYVAAFENKADVELSASTIRARLGIGVKAEAEPGAAPAEPGAAPAEPAAPAAPAEPAPAAPAEPAAAPAAPAEPAAAPAEPAAAPAAPAEPAPAAAPAEPAAAPAEGGEGDLDINAILADAGVEVPTEPAPAAAPAAPAEPAPAAPAEPAPAAPAAAPTEPVAKCGGGKKKTKADAGGGTEPVAPAAPAAPAEPAPAAPAAPAEPAPAAAPAEPAAAPAEPAPAEPGAEETPVLDIAAIMADAGVEIPAEPAAAPAEPAAAPAEPAPAAAPAEPAAAPAEPAPAAAPAAKK